MSGEGLRVREAREEDAACLAGIYEPYVRETAVTFEYEPPDDAEFVRRIRRIKERYPYLVCEKDGLVAGYVYLSAYSPREAYAWTATTSIYVRRDCRRQGAGSRLYRELEAGARRQGIVNLLAGVAYCENEDEYLTHDSYKFHLQKGYEKVAHMKAVGKKFGRWYDLLWQQKRLCDV